jgi:modification methylase
MSTPRSCVNGNTGAAVPQRAVRAPFSMQGFFSTGAPTLTNERKTADLPLAVWPCAQRTSQWQRYKRYLPESNRHPGKMLPALARRAIESYSEPGDLVVDPMCGIGTTLVEASDLGRRVVGVELEARWARLASANLDHVHGERRTRSLALVAEGDARELARVLTVQARRLLERDRGAARPIASGAVDLILTSPPYACEVADVNEIGGPDPLRRDDTTNYSRDRRNLGHARGDSYLTAMGEIYRACAAVLKPGGFMVCVTKDMRSGGGGAPKATARRSWRTRTCSCSASRSEPQPRQASSPSERRRERVCRRPRSRRVRPAGLAL